MLPICSICGNEKGFALPVALAFLAILGLMGSTAVVTTTTDMKIGRKLAVSEQAFCIAQAGIEEARARLKADAGLGVYISDSSHEAHADWAAYIGSDVKAQGKGWIFGNPKHVKVSSLSDLNYMVTIVHKTDGAGNVLYWSDTNNDGIPEANTTGGQNIYLVTSYGYASNTEESIQAEIVRLPPVTVPSALYVEGETMIQGNSTIDGTDSCGTDDKSGIVTSQTGGVTISGESATVTGLPSAVEHSGTDMDVQSIVDSFKADADFSYTVEGATHTGTTTPGPGDGWGDPGEDITTCDVNNIVHYDTGGTSVKLASNVTGCGILLIEGDLDLNGSFSWHGIIVVTGSIRFTGGGSGDKNIAGGLITGGSADADLIGGNTNIVYCSSAISAQTNNRPLIVLSWKEEM